MIKILFRFFEKEEYAKQFMSGKIRFSPLSKYSKVEDKKVRGDKDEKIEYMFNPKDTELVVDGIKAEGVINITYNSHGYENNNKICCFYILETDKNTAKFKYDQKIFDGEFGEYCIMFYHSDEFVHRIAELLKIKNFSFKLGEVKYCELNNINGKKCIFHKSIEYEWQNEFRIAIEAFEDDVITLDMGDISDICTVGKFKDIISEAKIFVN